MKPITFLFFAGVGLGLLVAGVFACRYLFRGFGTRKIALVWLLAEFFLVLSGFVLGCLFAGFVAQPTPTLKTHGIPFLEGVDELNNQGRWEDFVGIITFPAFAGNFLVGLLVPQIIFAVVAHLRLKKRPALAKN